MSGFLKPDRTFCCVPQICEFCYKTKYNVWKMTRVYYLRDIKICNYYFMTKQETVALALSYFDEGYACSQSVLLAYAEQFELNARTAKLISSTFGGGMGRLRQKCGAVTGAFMILGLAYGNSDPKDMDTKLASYKKVRELNHLFEDIHGTTICAEILKKHATEADVTERNHHKLICRRVIGDVAAMVYDMLQHENTTV